MSTEVALVFSWLESTLSGDTTLQGLAPGGVFQTFQMPGTTTPYMLVKFVSGNDYVVFGGSRSYADMRFRVMVVGPIAGQQALWNAAARIDTLITVGQQTAVTGGIIMASFQDQPVSEDSWVDSAKWDIAGGEYRIMAKGS